MKFLSHDGTLYFWKKVKLYIDTKYNELFQSVSNGKSLVASAITDKGITTDATATFATMASNIDNISTGVETYDATAIETDVLSGKTYYKDNVKKTGTMPNYISKEIGGMYNTSSSTYTDIGVYDHYNGGNYLEIITRPTSNGYVDSSTKLKTWIPNLTKEKVQAGLVFGTSGGAQLTGTYTSDATATASDIISGKIAYAKGAKITGTNPGQTDVLNFPLSIQDAQPTGVRNGHIWIKSSTLASKITSASIQENLNTGVADKSLQFVVGETSNNYLMLRNTAKRLTSGGNNINMASTQNNGGAQSWLVSSVSNVIEYKLNRPMIYSKVNNMLDLETAYFYNGSSWEMTQQKNNYLIVSHSNPRCYTMVDKGLSYSQTISGMSGGAKCMSADGTYWLRWDSVWKRTGDVFAKYCDIPSSITVNSKSHSRQSISGGMSNSGKYVAFVYQWDSGTAGSSSSHVLVVYKNDGTAFTQLYQLQLSTFYAGSSASIGFKEDGTELTAIGVRCSDKLIVVFNKNGTLTQKAATRDGYMMERGETQGLIWFVGNKMYSRFKWARSNALEDYTWGTYRWNIDYTNQTVSPENFITSTTYETHSDALGASTIAVHKSTGSLVQATWDSTNKVYVSYWYNINSNTRLNSYLPAFASNVTSMNVGGIALNLNRDRMAFLLQPNKTGNYFIYYYSFTIDTAATGSNGIAFTLLGTYDTGSTSGGGFEICPN
jgi:hypothetical protein